MSARPLRIAARHMRKEEWMETKNELKMTPFLPFHEELGGKMVAFAGWLMPLQFSGILNEHRAVRSGVGLFDVSHMGRLEVTGDGALSFVQMITTNDVSALEPGMVQYSTICNDSGGILDDVTVYRFDDRIALVVNASNREKIVSWMREHAVKGAELSDRTFDTAQLAVQGPGSQSVLQKLVSFDLEKIPFYHFETGDVAGRECVVSRTGYTGEDGFEIYLPVEHSGELGKALISDKDVCCCGLGARDLLRLEFKYCLYGNDIDESTSPLEAGLGWLVKFDKDDFIGRDALLAEKEKGSRRRLIAFSLLGKGVPRPGYPVVDHGEAVSRVSSGAFSPSLGKGIGTAYLPVELCGAGTRIEIEIRKKRAPAEVVKPPFYRHGSRR